MKENILRETQHCLRKELRQWVEKCQDGSGSRTPLVSLRLSHRASSSFPTGVPHRFVSPPCTISRKYPRPRRLRHRLCSRARGRNPSSLRRKTHSWKKWSEPASGIFGKNRSQKPPSKKTQ